MTILGIDPGSLFTGYGLIQVQDQGFELEDMGIIILNSKTTLQQRLKKIYDCLIKVIKRKMPNEISLESIVVGKNASSALKLAHARAMVLLAAEHYGIHVTEYAPTSIKKALTGNGHASKDQVAYMVSQILNIDTHIKKLDGVDAAAIALTHAYQLQTLIQA